MPPEALDGDSALYAAYREELDRLGPGTATLRAPQPSTRLEGDLDAWHGEPVFAYGFEDLTGAEWRLLEALAGPRRGDGLAAVRAGPARLRLARADGGGPGRARGRPGHVELAPAYALESRRPRSPTSSARSSPTAPRPRRRRSTARSAGSRAPATAAPLELVAEEVLALVRAGHGARGDRRRLPVARALRAPLETAFATLGRAVRGRRAACGWRTPFGKALLALLRFDWRGPARRDLFASCARRTRASPGRTSTSSRDGSAAAAIRDERVEEETIRLRGAPAPAPRLLRGAARSRRRDAVAGSRDAARRLRARARRRRARTAEPTCAPSRRCDACSTSWTAGPASAAPPRATTCSRRSSGRRAAPPGPASGTCRGARPHARARTRPLRGRLRARPRGGQPAAPRRLRRRFSTTTCGASSTASARLARPDAARARPLPLLHRLHARVASGSRSSVPPRATTAHRARPARSGTRRRRSSTRTTWRAGRGAGRSPQLTWPLEAAPTERERLRGLAALAATDADGAAALALANGWERRLERALTAFRRPTRLTHPAVLGELAARTSFGVTELERFADCSSMWLVERLVSPRSIDAEVDARLRGSVAHTTLHRFFAGLPKRLGGERVEAERLDEALAFLRECLDEALAGVRLDLSQLERHELGAACWRDLEGLVRAEAELETPLVPRRFELSFGNERSAPGAPARPRPGRVHAVREDRPRSTSTPSAPARSSRTTSRAHRAVGGEDRVGAAAADPALHARAARPRGARAARRGLPAAGRASESRAACSAPSEGRARLPPQRLRLGRRVLAARGRGARPRRRHRRPHARRRRAPRPEGRRLSRVVRALVDRAGSGAHDRARARDRRRRRRRSNPEQEAAIEARGLVFVSAGAGTGKTRVLVERFARAVCDDGVDVESILVITYTERAAGELRGRIRARLAGAGPGRPRAARSTAPGSRPSTASATGC